MVQQLTWPFGIQLLSRAAAVALLPFPRRDLEGAQVRAGPGMAGDWWIGPRESQRASPACLRMPAQLLQARISGQHRQHQRTPSDAPSVVRRCWPAQQGAAGAERSGAAGPKPKTGRCECELAGPRRVFSLQR